MDRYWADRQLKAQDAVANKTEREIKKQLARYYKKSMEKVISDFEATYDKLQATMEDGREPTPADLYKLDKYWQMQSQLKHELQKLGDKEVALLSKQFENEWNEVYESISLPSDTAFSTISTGNAQSMINTVWLPDGKTYSQRIWKNIDKLAETLNDNLIHCVITGKKTDELSRLLRQRFNVSKSQADTLVNTEITHIQTEAAKQRYQDYGLTEYEFLGREERDGCSNKPSCHELNGKVFKYAEMQAGVNAPPMHPNCRCTIIPVVNTEDSVVKDGKEMINEEHKKNLLNKMGTQTQTLDTYRLLFTLYGEEKARDEVKSRLVNGTDGLKAMFIKQLESTSRKIINKGEKREIKEMIEDWGDTMFAQCIDCGRVFPKNNPKSNAAKRCPECQAEYRRKYKAQKKKEAAEKKKREKYEQKRKADKAAWARENRKKKKKG